MEISSPPPPKMTDDNSRCVDKNPAVKEISISGKGTGCVICIVILVNHQLIRLKIMMQRKFDKSEEKETRLLRCYSYRSNLTYCPSINPIVNNFTFVTKRDFSAT
ncbi:uncharacterized protein LOC122498628 [Leptopilina heterotoma]|uniref:uncharacterized protein LOC122498628 n=1 Tax=Leptopilina heterotoma TaxID=63436 RepID=UPI001CA9F609|nr:uncharacterized protein LOC122498628 [Leptopilina heterotoma]